jgi:hypothetical protein
VSAGLADRVDTLNATVRRLGSPRGRAALDEKRAALDISSPSESDPAARPARADYTPEERNRLLAVLAD